MTRSESINELATALSKAQGEILAAKKDSENPHFRSKYADLGSVWDAIRAALTKHGLSVVQSPRLITTHENVWFVEVETTMLHQSGQSLSDTLAMPLASPTAQGVGSACTYARRYALAAFAGVAASGDDDDANGASEPPKVVNDIQTVTVKILGIVKRPLKDDPVRTKFILSADDKHTYHTFSLTFANEAKAAQEAGVAVVIRFKDTTYGRMIQTLKEVDSQELGPEPPL